MGDSSLREISTDGILAGLVTEQIDTYFCVDYIRKSPR